jgi:hypothetical protein
LLPKEFFDGGCSDGSERSCLNPLGEILDCNHCELEVALGCGKRSNNTHSPALQRPCGRDELRWSARPSLMLCGELAGFAGSDDVLNILYRHWPIETLSESFSGQSSRCYVRPTHSSVNFPHELDALFLRDAF